MSRASAADRRPAISLWSISHIATARSLLTYERSVANLRRHDLLPSSRVPLLLACGGSFLAFLDVTITNLAVPDLASDFGVGVTSLSWVVTLYTILFAALLAPAGRLADVVGRRRLFVAGVATFTVASAGRGARAVARPSCWRRAPSRASARRC